MEQKSIGVAVHYRMPYCKTHPDLVRPEMGAARSSAHRPHDARCTGLPDGGRGGDPRVPVACRVQTPVRPAMPTAALSPGLSLDRFAASATAEIELREGYEIELRAALDTCTAPIAPF